MTNHFQKGGLGIANRLPPLIPGQHVGIFFEALGKILFAESVHHFRVFHVGLFDELLGRLVIIFILSSELQCALRLLYFRVRAFEG